MTVVRKFTPEVRLKKLLAESGGIRADEALARADKGIEDIRGYCLDAIDAKIEQIMALAQPGQSDIERCYVLSNEIYAEAGTFGLAELSVAAHSLCSLLSSPERNRIPLTAIHVHVDSMRVLRTPAVSANKAMRGAVLGELRKLTAKYAQAAAAG
ncbi:MAG: hypothetical protein R3C25_14640 [Hyphomonadaceae bacterium]